MSTLPGPAVATSGVLRIIRPPLAEALICLSAPTAGRSVPWTMRCAPVGRAAPPFFERLTACEANREAGSASWSLCASFLGESHGRDFLEVPSNR